VVLRGSLQPLPSLQTSVFTVHHLLFSGAWNILLVWKPRRLLRTVTEDSVILSVSRFYLDPVGWKFQVH
jgi:hypothetical protein